MERSRRASQKTTLWGRRRAGASSQRYDETPRHDSLRRCRTVQFCTCGAAEWQEPFPICLTGSVTIRSSKTPKNDELQWLATPDRSQEVFVRRLDVRSYVVAVKTVDDNEERRRLRHYDGRRVEEKEKRGILKRKGLRRHCESTTTLR